MSTSLLNFSKLCNQYLLSNSSEDVKSVINYLESRGYGLDDVKRFNIGFFPFGEKIPREIRHFGEDLNSSKKRDWRHNICGRVLLPISDEFGEIISLASKKISQGKNPWWNLPFCKTNSLFLIEKSKSNMFLQNKVYIVEGYCDAMRLFSSGITNVVALMGTSLTTRKIAIIARYCNNVCLCFDSDENGAGQNACEESVIKLNYYSIFDSISVIDNIPIGEDPDSYVRSNGINSYLEKERELSSSDIEIILEKVYNEKRKK